MNKTILIFLVFVFAACSATTKLEESQNLKDQTKNGEVQLSISSSVQVSD